METFLKNARKTDLNTYCRWLSCFEGYRICRSNKVVRKLSEVFLYGRCYGNSDVTRCPKSILGKWLHECFPFWLHIENRTFQVKNWLLIVIFKLEADFDHFLESIFMIYFSITYSLPIGYLFNKFVAYSIWLSEVLYKIYLDLQHQFSMIF